MQDVCCPGGEQMISLKCLLFGHKFMRVSNIAIKNKKTLFMRVSNIENHDIFGGQTVTWTPSDYCCNCGLTKKELGFVQEASP